MTIAERYREERKPVWDSAKECLLFIQQLDQDAKVMATDIGPVVLFSDGSKHRFGG